LAETYKHVDLDAGRTLIKAGFETMLEGMELAYGLDLSDPNLVDTPARVTRAYDEIFGGLRDTEEKVAKILSTAFPCGSSEMVLQKDIRVFSMCPHHFLPVEYTATVAYIPGEGGHVLGLSKLARLTEVLARRPVLQEQLVADVTRHLMSVEGCTGAACFAKGRHFCMCMRGAKQADAVTITSSLRGAFLDDDVVRQEFLLLARG
jgi:GTP cyclohydrolase I